MAAPAGMLCELLEDAPGFVGVFPPDGFGGDGLDGVLPVDGVLPAGDGFEDGVFPEGDGFAEGVTGDGVDDGDGVEDGAGAGVAAFVSLMAFVCIWPLDGTPAKDRVTSDKDDTSAGAVHVTSFALPVALVLRTCMVAGA